ncbi:hypothetical protein CsSME_00030416 [Camellia sinensis var. sinensis]|uniref:homeobox-leucine zipper protein ATHB-52-like isoform X1 n=1 Tax=Camellia sinensis TaxID=4442 RepID=UPI001035C71A|nr:homeobox-leucine zipper protein ATHB-52-like isoform X1 [Camellia sinensis]XP_028121708.1 homeobox-leucine zipper protein ATHB-52-like isoform X2 [Camellia sinensis]
MDYFQSHSHTRKHPLKCNKRLTQEQVRLLETSFNFNNRLDPDRKSQLAEELGLPPRQVAIWYQNKRARWKNQSLEADYKSLHEKLENVLEDNERLQREVERLRQELDKAQDMLLSFNNMNNTTNNSSLSNSCDEVGSSSFIHDHHHQSIIKVDDHDHHLDKELYACLIDGNNFFAPIS